MEFCWKYHQGLYTWTRALRTLFVYTEFTKKKVFEQLTLAVACSASRRHGRPDVFRDGQSKLCAHKQCSQCSCSCVETLVILRAKFHVVSSPLSVLKIEILMLSLICPAHSHLKWVWPENKNTVNLKSASFVVVMLFHEGLSHIYIHKKSLGRILARVSL